MSPQIIGTLRVADSGLLGWEAMGDVPAYGREPAPPPSDHGTAYGWWGVPSVPGA